MKDYTEAEKDIIKMTAELHAFIATNTIVDDLPSIGKCLHALRYFRLREKFLILVGRANLGGFDNVLNDEEKEMLKASLYELSNMFTDEICAKIGNYLLENVCDLPEHHIED